MYGYKALRTYRFIMFIYANITHMKDIIILPKNIKIILNTNTFVDSINDMMFDIFNGIKTNDFGVNSIQKQGVYNDMNVVTTNHNKYSVYEREALCKELVKDSIIKENFTLSFLLKSIPTESIPTESIAIYIVGPIYKEEEYIESDNSDFI